MQSLVLSSFDIVLPFDFCLLRSKLPTQQSIYAMPYMSLVIQICDDESSA